MQPLTAAPYRQGYTSAQIIALLGAQTLTVQSGLDLLDQNNNWLQDISTNLISWSLTRNCTDTIHQTGTFVVTQLLQGGYQRVRPYMLLTGAGLTDVRWDLGVYVMASPLAQLNQTPISYSINGSDLLYVLNTPIGDSYAVAAGTGYLAAIETAFTAAGTTGSQLLLDGTAAAATIPVALSWPLGGGYTWLDVINQLLQSVNYLPLWADWEGNFRGAPYVPPAQLTPEFTFDLTQNEGVIVLDPRTMTNDLWQAPNAWIYVNENVDGPTIGAGIYEYTNETYGPSSVAAVGRTIYAPSVDVNVADQPTLVATANQAINQAIQLVAELDVALSPFPNSWHYDTVTYTDPQLVLAGYPETVTCQVQSWTLNSDASDGSQVWDIIGPPVV